MEFGDWIRTAERKGSEEAYNRSAAYAYDSLGRLVSCMEGADSETYSYGYDRRGNLTEERRNDSLIRQYTYDAADRMVLGQNLETGEESGYVYNALGRRVKDTGKRNGILTETEYTADYIGGVWNDLMQYRTGGAVTRNVYGRSHELLSRRTDPDPAGKTYYHADLYGSPLMAADGEGNFRWYAERDIWGNLKERRGTGEDAWGDSLRFTTYPYDPVTGKHFAYARMYDGMQGRMHAKDPVKRGLNGYTYCDNDPVNHVDPDGEFAHIAVAALGGAATGGVTGFVSSAISQRKSGEKFSLKKALGAAAEGAVTGGAKGAMISSGFGAVAMFAGDLASGTVGHMLNRAISGKKQNLGESLWGGLTNAVSGLFGMNKAVKGAAKSAGKTFGREFAEGAVMSAMNYIHDTAGIGDAGSSRDYTPGASMAIAAGKSSLSWKTGRTKDPRSSCGTKDTFSGGIGSQSTRGYQQRGNRRRSGTKSGFSLGGMLRSAVLGGLVGGLTGTAIHGMSKAVDVVAGSIVAERRGRQQRIVEDEGSSYRYINGQRRSKFHELTDTEIANLKKDIKEIGADESFFRFNEGFQTGYSDKTGLIYVKGDVLPDMNSIHPRDLMSSKAVLAHEYYGHKYFADLYGNRNPMPTSWNDEFRASYNAALNAPNLGEWDRMYLMSDALERAKAAGVNIKITDTIRRIYCERKLRTANKWHT